VESSSQRPRNEFQIRRNENQGGRNKIQIRATKSKSIFLPLIDIFQGLTGGIRNFARSRGRTRQLLPIHMSSKSNSTRRTGQVARPLFFGISMTIAGASDKSKRLSPILGITGKTANH
jgi:hypothetical protein